MNPSLRIALCAACVAGCVASPSALAESSRPAGASLAQAGSIVTDAGLPVRAPRLDALPSPVGGAAAPTVDLEALAKGFAAQADGQPDILGAAALAKGPGLLVFVSLSMPRPTLERLFDQAGRARASIVLRGFTQGSLRQTTARLQPLIAGRQMAVQVDPQAFDRFSISQVPTFVLVRDGARPQACSSGTCPPPATFVRVAGDVSLDYALEQMQRASPDLRKEASVFRARLRQDRR